MGLLGKFQAIAEAVSDPNSLSIDREVGWSGPLINDAIPGFEASPCSLGALHVASLGSLMHLRSIDHVSTII
jgi:hypothetical protein